MVALTMHKRHCILCTREYKTTGMPAHILIGKTLVTITYKVCKRCLTRLKKEMS